MNFKKTMILLSFLLFLTSKMYSQVMFQAYLIDGKDTLTMWTTFVTDSYTQLSITSNRKDMSLSTCMSGGFTPTWKIENDSIFLVELLDGSNMRDSPIIVNIEKVFKEGFHNGRVFGKEINYQIDAAYRDSYNSNNLSHYMKQICFTIQNGKVIDRGIFEDKTEYDVDAQYQPDSLIARYTNWKNFPDIAVDRKVTIEILTDDNGKIIEAHPIKNHEYPYSLEPIKKEGEEIWKQEALRLVKLIPRWWVSYKCGQVVNKEHDLVFLFTKPQ